MVGVADPFQNAEGSGLLAGKLLILVIGQVVAEDKPYTVPRAKIHCMVVVVGLSALAFLSEYEVALDEFAMTSDCTRKSKWLLRVKMIGNGYTMA